MLYGTAFVVGLLVHSLQPTTVLPLPTALLCGLPVLVLGGLLAVWGKRTLHQAGTNVDPARPATVLVVTGPFRFSRNPMYLARTLLYAGLALVMNTLWPLIALAPLLVLIQRGVIYREERYLDAKFGHAYRQYQARVRRWL
jgi:protein-S-isoprenylcysteine O-methyltransferase Ste14